MNGERLELVREDEGECGSVRGSGEKQKQGSLPSHDDDDDDDWKKKKENRAAGCAHHPAPVLRASLLAACISHHN